LIGDLHYDVSDFFVSSDGNPITFDQPKMSDGDPLESWISFDSVNKILIFNDDDTNSGTVKVTARSFGGTTTSQSFYVAIKNTVPSISQKLGSITTIDNTTFSFSANLSETFTDNDALQVLYFSITSFPVFATATISGDILSVSGNASAFYAGSTYEVVIRASDTFDYREDSLKIKVNENYPPSRPSGFTSLLIALEDANTTHTIETFNDNDGDALSYSMTFSDDTALDSSWITFNTITREINFLANSSTPSFVPLKLTVQDTLNAPVTETITINVKFKPVDNSVVLDRAGEFVCLSQSAFQIDRNILIDDANIVSYSMVLSDGSPIPSWVTIKTPLTSSSGNFELNGTYPNFENSEYIVTVTATDEHGLSGSANFSILTKCN